MYCIVAYYLNYYVEFVSLWRRSEAVKVYSKLAMIHTLITHTKDIYPCTHTHTHTHTGFSTTFK